MMAHGPECPCEAGADHEGESWAHDRGSDEERTAGDEDRGGRGKRGWGHRGRGPGAGADGQDVMRELGALGVRFYPPPMLLRRAAKVGLTPDQVAKIRQETLSMQSHAVDLFAKARHAEVDIVRLLSADKIDEHAVFAQIDEAARAKAEMHKLRLEMVLRVRALLTPEQLQKLKEHKPRHDGPKAGAGAVGEADSDGDGDEDEADSDDDSDGSP